MKTNDSNDRDMERLLEQHFASGADKVPPTPDLWASLEGRLGDQDPKPLWAGIRDWAFPPGGFNGVPPLAATAAAVVVIAIAGSVGYVIAGLGSDGSGGPGISGVPISGVTPAPMATAAAAPTATARVETVVVEKMVEGESVVVVQTVIVEKPVTRVEKVLETVVVEKVVEGKTVRVVETVIVEKPVTVTEKVIETVVVERVLAGPTPTPAAAMVPPAATPAPQPTAMPAATGAPAARPTGTPAPAGAHIAADPEKRSLPNQPGATTFEDYERQPLTEAAEDAVSTFSLDTDRTSFQLALNWARSGYQVDPASVRAEEWVNAFDYGYAAPAVDDRFAITSDLFEHPLDNGRYMARVAFKAPEVVTDAPLNVTLVLDASGSMSSGNRVAIAREAADAIRRSLDRDDRISVVHFTTHVIDSLTVENAAPDDRAVSDSIAWLAPHDSTNVQAGLDLGVRLADKMRRERPDALNYVVLMSDGVANVDATDPFAILEATSAPDGANPLRLITVGVGIENYNDQLLEQLAQHGNGWYRYLFDEEQARSTFRRDNWLALASPVADQTRAQVVWDPDVVKAWRIVGYENRVTSAESFTQDRKEFAEVYSGAATTVFYELEVHHEPRQKTALGQVELRWVEPNSGRGWSQSTEVVSGLRVQRLDHDPMLGFGAVVALTADRYSALGDSLEPSHGLARDLWRLWDLTEDLQNDLNHLAAFHDFADVLQTLLLNVPYVAPDNSGYSR